MLEEAISTQKRDAGSGAAVDFVALPFGLDPALRVYMASTRANCAAGVPTELRDFIGEPSGTRTRGPLIKNPVQGVRNQAQSDVTLDEIEEPG